MKKILITVMVLLCFALRGYGQTKAEKQIIGKWCNPYTYQSTGELKGFEFKKGGKCSAINIPVYDLRTWKIDEEGYLIIDGFSKEDSDEMQPFHSRERIGYLSEDSLELVSREKNPRLVFLYINAKKIKKLVTPEVAPKEE